MRVGLQVPRFHWSGGPEQIGRTFGDIARRAEDAGFYSFWVMDHFFQIRSQGPKEEEMLEGYSALSFAAGKTERIRLGTLVTGVTYRYPGILVKTATTLDVLSGGRAYFGVGAAWNEEEHRGLGVPFPPLSERFERLEELLQIALQMWSGEAQAYSGKHYHLANALNVPNALQRPHPPILIGGSGEQKTLRLVAQYADACNLFSSLQPGVLEHKLDVLRGHCEKLGRPYEQIEKTTLGTLHLSRSGGNGTQSPAEAVAYFQRLAALGIDQAIVNMPNVSDPDVFKLLATEVIPAVTELPVAGR
ncbi:MAG TPA: LLM class F420-dependent oxidoreductase [Ktedonobacterales bacterium]